MSIEDRLNIYGAKPEWRRAYCPICDELRETVFFRIDGEMVCRKHPGHPLYEESGGPGHLEDRIDPSRLQTGRV